MNQLRTISLNTQARESTPRIASPLDAPPGGGEQPRPRRLRPLLTPEERFWPKVDKNGPVSVHRPDLGPCWLYHGKHDRDGYPCFTLRHHKEARAYRVAYEFLIGPFPAGFTFDHLCRNRGCTNPFHGEPVTNRVNVLRGIGPTAVNALKTHCIHGHPFDASNTYFFKGYRLCRTCRRESDASRYRNKQADAKAPL